MKRTIPFALIAIFSAISCQALEAGKAWEPMSGTATAITGKVTLKEGKSISFENGVTMDLESIGSDAPETKLYRITSNGTKALKGGNTLCGSASDSQDAAPTYLVAKEQGETLNMLVFVGPEAPKVASDSKTAKSLELDDNICATYSYTK